MWDRGEQFKGRQLTAEVILWAVRWYLQFPISYRDLELMLQDRGVSADHTTIFRWIQAYAAELDKRIRPHLRMSNGSWRVDETYVKIKGRWTYLYRAVDSQGQTIDFLLSAKRDAEAAKRFSRKALGQPHIPRLPGNPRNPLARRRDTDSTVGMIRRGFLDSESRKDLTELARDGSAAHRLARRANALVLLDDGMSCEAVAKVLLLDDDTVRAWYRLYEEDGIEGLASFGYEGGACRLSEEQQEKLKAWISETLPRTTREVGAWIERECGIEYQGRSGLIALLHRLGMEHRKPKTVSRKLDPKKQAAFIKAYEVLLNQLEADEVVLFADAVHPTHAVRPVGCWAPKDTPIAVAQTSGRQRLNIHGAIDLETGHTRMLEVETVDAVSTIRLMIALLASYPRKRVIHLFLDNARYHHAKLVQAWLARPGCRIKLHFIPTYSAHLDPIERLWGLMHKHITHNTCHETFKDFREAILTFLREEVPRNWRLYCDEVTDNFRIISPKDFRILA